MKMTYIRLLILAVIIGGVGALSLFVWPGPLKKIPVQGYVFMPKRDIEAVTGSFTTKVFSQKRGLVEVANDRWDKKQPAAGIDIGIKGRDTRVKTDEKGFFEITERNYILSDAHITLSVGRTGQVVAYPVSPHSGSAKADQSNLHIVNILENGDLEIAYMDREIIPDHSALTPVLMVHGFGPDIGLFKLPMENKRWHRVKTFLEKDEMLSEFDFFLFTYPNDQDIIHSSRELYWAIERLTRIYDQKVTLLGFSMGGLVCRHYLVSDWHMQNSVDKLLMVGTPNHGCDLALMHFDSCLEDGDGAASVQLISGSEFLNALNNRTSDPALKQRLHINADLQDERGLNPHVTYAIIAGEVTKSLRERITRSRNGFLGNARDIVGAWDQLLFDLFGKGIDKDLIMEFFRESADAGSRSIEKVVDKIPPGDLIVTLDSALIPEVPYITVPYTHLNLIIPEDRKDCRYTHIRIFLIEGILQKTPQQALQNL